MPLRPDPRPPEERIRAKPIDPDFQIQRLAIEIVRAGLPGTPGPEQTRRARELAERHRPRLAQNENGSPLWEQGGGYIEGDAGRYGLALEIAKSERIRAAGRNPADMAVEQSEALGVPPAAARRLLGNRLRRREDGSIALSMRALDQHGRPLPERVGGEELVRVAVQQVLQEYEESARNTPSPEALAAHKTAAARRGIRYSV